MIDCKEERSTRFCQIFAALYSAGNVVGQFLFLEKIFSAVATQGRSDDEEEDVSLLPPLLGLVPVLQECVVVFALWDVLGGVALLGELVVDKSELAALLAGGDPVQADVELGTVVRVGVLGMGVELAELIGGSLLGASEPVVGLVGVGLAILPVGDLGPVRPPSQVLRLRRLCQVLHLPERDLPPRAGLRARACLQRALQAVRRPRERPRVQRLLRIPGGRGPGQEEEEVERVFFFVIRATLNRDRREYFFDKKKLSYY